LFPSPPKPPERVATSSPFLQLPNTFRARVTARTTKVEAQWQTSSVTILFPIFVSDMYGMDLSIKSHVLVSLLVRSKFQVLYEIQFLMFLAHILLLLCYTINFSFIHLLVSFSQFLTYNWMFDSTLTWPN
jgi:hypothetical protein